MHALSGTPMGARLLLISLLLQLCSAAALQDASAEVVRSGHDLLAALANGATSQIVLGGDVHLQAEDAQAFQLPLLISRNVTVASELGERYTLDFGYSYSLLQLEPGVRLTLSDLRVQGVPAKEDGLAAGKDENEIRIGPLWPTVKATVGHLATFDNVSYLASNYNCTRDRVKVYMESFRQYLFGNATLSTPFASPFDPDFVPELTLYGTGTRQQMPFAITVIATHVPVGNAYYIFDNFILSCRHPSLVRNATFLPPVSSAPQGSGGSTPVWLWLLVGLLSGLAALAAAAVAALLVMRRRQRQQLAAQSSTILNSSSKTFGEVLVLPAAAGNSGSGATGVSGGFGLGGQGLWNGPFPSRTSLDRNNALGAAIWNTRVGPLEDMELGEMLGHGSFGRCYKGRWKGALVAAKVVEQRIHEGRSYDLAREPLLSLSVSHPNVVQTFKLSFVCVKLYPQLSSFYTASTAAGHHSGSGSADLCLDSPRAADELGSSIETGSGCQDAFVAAALASQLSAALGEAESLGAEPGSLPLAAASRKGTVQPLELPCAHLAPMGPDGFPEITPGEWNIWLLMEFCDRGCLTDAIHEGRFLVPGTQRLNMAPLLLSLLDIAQGMEYLHGIHILHGDLKGRNVLLKSARNDKRGYTLKIADFGLSHMLDQQQSHVDTKSWGTATHAAPELLRHGRLTPAADVYAFGILIWEMVAGKDVYDEEDLSTFQIIHRVSTERSFRPPIPPQCPPQLAALMCRCWAFEPEFRPTFSEAVQELREMLRSFRRASEDRQRPPLPGTGQQEPVSLDSPQTS